MSPRKKGRSIFRPSVRLCPAMKRCDGVVLPPGREMCKPCELSFAVPKQKALKGEHVVEYQAAYRRERRGK